MAIDRITTGAVLDGAIATADIADNAVTIGKLEHRTGHHVLLMSASGVPESGLIGANNVASNGITTAKITDGNVTSAKLNYPLTTFSSTGIDDNADATALTIDSGENVAIGVTSKNSANNGSLTIGHTGMTKITGTANGNADELVLIGADASANVGMSIISNNANIGGIFFGDEDDTDIGRIEYNHSDNSMRLYSNTAEQLRLHSNGVLSASDGIALGVGLNNTASNVLDDYEEGTFTAQISTDSTYTGETQSGVYTKMGDIVFIQIRFQRSGTLNSGSNARFSLPFTAANNGVQASGFRGSVENVDTSMVGIGGTIAANNTVLYLNEMTAATTGHNVNGNDLGANFQVQIQGFYKTA